MTYKPEQSRHLAARQRTDLHASPRARSAPSPRPGCSPCGRHQRRHQHPSVLARDAQVAQTDSAVLATVGMVPEELPRETLKLVVEVISSMDQVSAEDWDACATGDGTLNPFLLHAFLLALETSRSAVREEGWLPQHVLVRNEATKQLVGAVPMYLKSHSYGEYVFDHSWAHSCSRLTAQRYYPKLQSCVPFTPATGARLLLAPGPNAAAVRRALATTLKTITDNLGVSSLHVTFNTAAEADSLREVGFLQRTGIQYHWENQGYTSFDDFLMALKQSKRKNIRQERKHVAASGLRLERLRGSDLKPAHWDTFYRFYRNTTDHKWGQAYLTREFFHRIGETMGKNVLLVVAREGPGTDGDVVAGALNLVGSHALFGRNWGCHPAVYVKHLHFETCYYQALEAAIELGLPRVEAGAQGEHKISRGYLPSTTYSSHYIADPTFRSAVGHFLDRESMDIEYRRRMLNEEASPYKDR